MEFSERLNSYVNLLGCTSSELARASGVSLATISRYRSGERTPSGDSPQVTSLAHGIAALSQARAGVPQLDEEDVHAKLSADASGILVDYGAFRANLATLLSELGYSNSELARAISYDPSYISRIISGSRHPADIGGFIEQVATVIARRYGNPVRADSIAGLVNQPVKAVSTPSGCAEAVRRWLASNKQPTENPIGGFLRKIDAFDLEEFARSIDFGSIKTTPEHTQLPLTRSYSGIAEIMEAELDFINATLASKSMEPVIIYSDMPLGELNQDPSFPKRWAYGMTLMLKKGLHVDMIHDISKPSNEMLLGLAGWVPMYMTGQISPYYLEESPSTIFMHNLKVSGGAALSGQAIVGHQSEGSYLVTRNKDEVKALTLRAKRVLERARPLMVVYTEDNSEELEELLGGIISDEGRRSALLSTPTVQTIPEDLLERILEDNGLDEGEKEPIRAFVRRRKAEFETFLKGGEFVAKLARLTREEFDRYPAMLPIGDMFPDRDITYTYEQYLEHIEAMSQEAGQREGFDLLLEGKATFRNIQLVVVEGKWALISKAKTPAVHFVIRNERLLKLIADYIANTNS